MRILFTGDSITDMQRRFEYEDCFPYSLGNGFVFFASEMLYQKDTSYEIINRGVGGNKITDLETRFDKDVIDMNADVVTILIGVNDVWHHFSHGAKIISTTKWEVIYQSFIDKIRKNNSKTRIIMMEPFYLPGYALDGFYADFAILKRYQKKAKQIAKKNNIEFIPLQNKLTKYGEKIGNQNVLYDGVHPNVLGSKFIAKEWFKQFNKKIQK